MKKLVSVAAAIVMAVGVITLPSIASAGVGGKLMACMKSQNPITCIIDAAAAFRRGGGKKF